MLFLSFVLAGKISGTGSCKILHYESFSRCVRFVYLLIHKELVPLWEFSILATFVLLS